MLMIHTADLHLGANPDAGEPWGKNRKQELWESFERLIEETRRQRADLLLIAGDLFHRPPLLRELREVNEAFASLEPAKVVLMAGNHDFLSENSFYKNFQWSDNVIFLQTEDISSVKIPQLGVEVYGHSYHQRECRERLYDFAHPDDNGYYHILLAHGGDEKHIPFSNPKLAKSGFDYIAFGHIHKPGMILPGKAAMAGSLEPTDHSCTGPHGYLRVEVVDGQNEITLVPFAKREYRCLEVKLTEQDTMRSLGRRILEMVEAEGKEHIYELILTGKRHVSLEILEEQMKSLANIRRISDCTEKNYDYDRLCGEYQGRLLQKYIHSFENADTELEKKALVLGTEAILEAMGQ